MPIGKGGHSRVNTENSEKMFDIPCRAQKDETSVKSGGKEEYGMESLTDRERQSLVLRMKQLRDSRHGILSGSLM